MRVKLSGGGRITNVGATTRPFRFALFVVAFSNFRSLKHAPHPHADKMDLPPERIKELMEHGTRELGSKKIVLVSDPVDVQTIMHSSSVIRNATMRSLAGDGLIFSDGKKWRERRRSLQPSFPPSKPEFHAAEVNWALEGLMARLRAFDKASESFPLLEELLRFTTRIIYKVATL